MGWKWDGGQILKNGDWKPKDLNDVKKPAIIYIHLMYSIPENSLSCSQELATGPYPEPDESSPYHPLPFF
jgi:hypothetical protein